MPSFFTLSVENQAPIFTDLADFHFGEAGQCFGMDRSSSPLRKAREAAGLSMPKLGEAASTSAQQIDRLERGERKLTREWAERLAPHLGVTPQSLIFPSSSVIPVVGLVGAGGSISTENESDFSEPLFEVDLPFNVGEAVGYLIAGVSMWPRYDDGDVIVASASREPPEMQLGLEAVVKVGDRDEPGDRFFKRLIRGADIGLFDLESYNAPPMRGLQIGWASSLICRVPAAHWRRRNGATAKKLPARRRPKKD